MKQHWRLHWSVSQLAICLSHSISYYYYYRSNFSTVSEISGVSGQKAEYRWSFPEMQKFKEHQNLAAELDCKKFEMSTVSK